MAGTRMLQRRGLAADWTSTNYILGNGEIGLETDTRLLKIGDGVSGWNLLAYTSPRGLVTAAGDLILGTGAKTVARLAKGTDGQYLTMDSGAVTWKTPPATDLSSTVALDGSRTMTGDQTLAKSDPKLLLTDNTAASTTDRLQMVANTGIQYIQVDDELHISAINGTISSPKPLRAGAMYDTGNRVYSLSNPPPAGAAVLVPGYNCHIWQPDAQDTRPLTGGTYTNIPMFKAVQQTAAIAASAVPAMYAGIPRRSKDQTTDATVILEGVTGRNGSGGTAVTYMGLAVMPPSGISNSLQFVGFSVAGNTGDVKAWTASGSGANLDTLIASATQRGSTQSAAVPVLTPKPFKITVTAAGVVTFVFDGVTMYTGNVSIPLADYALGSSSVLALIANGAWSGTAGVHGASFVVSYA